MSGRHFRRQRKSPPVIAGGLEEASDLLKSWNDNESFYPPTGVEADRASAEKRDLLEYQEYQGRNASTQLDGGRGGSATSGSLVPPEMRRGLPTSPPAAGP